MFTPKFYSNFSRITRNALSFLSAIVLSLTLTTCRSQEKVSYNLSFEKLDTSFKPVNWLLSFGSQNNGYPAVIDSTVKEDGKYSLKIEKSDGATGFFGVCYLKIPAKFKGSKIKLTGYLKTENITAGYGGLWLRIDGIGGMLSFDNMYSRGIKGSTDWKEYVIELPYNDKEAKKIILGGMLNGNGTMWVDNLHLFIDDIPIENVPLKPTTAADEDTTYSSGSHINSIELTYGKQKLLTNLGMIWGFLKYYHPAIAEGKYNWDAELFRHLPKILNSKNDDAAYKVIEEWIDSIGVVPACSNCTSLSPKDVKLPPDYGYLFLNNNLPDPLVKKLAYIRDNYKAPSNHYYIDFAPGVGNPVLKNENGYFGNGFPDAGFRLLALYRYWNIIQYFYPYRHLIGEDWNKVLTTFIPRFVAAKDNKEYTLACLEIIAHIHDTHANIWQYNPTLDSLKGLLMTPFKAGFVENKLVVTSFYKDTLGIKSKLHIGDIIEKIDGVPVEDLIKKFLPLTPASNYETQLRDMPRMQGFLLRGDKPVIHLSIKDNTENKEVVVERVPLRNIDYTLDYSNPDQTTGYKLLIPTNIGYIYPGKLKDEDISSIQKDFAGTKGLIIDLRSYPSTFMPFTYGGWLKDKASDFVKFTAPTLTMPGAITNGNALPNGSINSNHYKGKVVIIVTAHTQSNAEYTTMALATAPNVTVIGSTTAGADGNVSQISLPGGISTMISGIGIYYPDGTETQRTGIKIDIQVKPTIRGVREGRDELLEKAIDIINK